VTGVQTCALLILPRDPEIGRVLRLSGWGVLLHANAGMLLGAALIVGSSIAGGVVAYQVAFVFFLAPYSIFALPISTAILPELTDDVSRGDLDSFAATVRHALDRMAVIVLPISAVMVALALPGMRVVAFGRADGAGVELLAAALASLAVGLFPYGAFLLLARAYYALGDSRRPALVAIVSGIVGVVVMVVAALLTEGAARVAALGLGHTVSYLVGAVILGLDVRRRVAGHIWDADLGRAVLVALAVGVSTWAVALVIDPHDRAAAVAALALGAAVALAVFLASARVLRVAKAAEHAS